MEWAVVKARDAQKIKDIAQKNKNAMTTSLPIAAPENDDYLLNTYGGDGQQYQDQGGYWADPATGDMYQLMGKGYKGYKGQVKGKGKGPKGGCTNWRSTFPGRMHERHR